MASKWKVGDRAVIRSDSNGFGGGRGTVTYVGRAWITVTSEAPWFRERRFRIADGRERGDGAGGYCIAVTPGEDLEIGRAVLAFERLRKHGHSWDYRDALTADEMDQISDIIEAALARRKANKS